MLVGDFGPECDMWSIGVLLYVMICGRPPFAGSDDNKVMTSISRGDFEFIIDDWGDKSPEVQDLIRKLLVLEPRKRLSAKDALEHAWVQRTTVSPIEEQPPLCAVS